MQLQLTTEDVVLLVRQLNKRIEHVEDELAHTDKRELQRALVKDVQAMRNLAQRIESSLGAEARP
jgi:uncharacterized protein YukE